jgi:hypothetical protein
LAGRLLGALIQNPVAGVGHGFERNPEVAALTAEIGRLERAEASRCRHLHTYWALVQALGQ